MKLILLGAPGAGKGTQAENISRHYSIPTISTGNILREAIAAGTEVGLKAKAIMDRGELVPNDVVISLLKERTSQPDCANGFILDGFPRNIAQADALEELGIMIDRVISIEVEDGAIVERMSGRRTCPDCGASYHILYKPADNDSTVCTSCKGKLIQRPDDAPEVVLSRLKVFHDQTEPLKEYYSKKGILKLVIGQEKVEDTTRLTFEALA